jgi:hypothetical protein
MGRGLELSLLAHGFAGGAALLLLALPLVGLEAGTAAVLRWTLAGALAAQAALALLARRLAPPRREREYAAALHLLHHGPLCGRHRAALALGVLAPLALLLASGSPWALGAAATLALAGMWLEQDTFVRAGQAPAIS